MDNAHHDQVFFRTFAIVLGVLVGIMFAIMGIAAIVTDDPEATDPLRLAKVEQNLQPVARVITDPAMLVESAPAEAKADTRSAEQIVQGVCAACHDAGVLGAPKSGDKAAWQARLTAAGSVDKLIEHAINGINAMPPRGGDPSLGDEQIAEAVRLLLKDAGL